MNLVVLDYLINVSLFDQLKEFFDIGLKLLAYSLRHLMLLLRHQRRVRLMSVLGLIITRSRLLICSVVHTWLNSLLILLSTWSIKRRRCSDYPFISNLCQNWPLTMMKLRRSVYSKCLLWHHLYLRYCFMPYIHLLLNILMMNRYGLSGCLALLWRMITFIRLLLLRRFCLYNWLLISGLLNDHWLRYLIDILMRCMQRICWNLSQVLMIMLNLCKVVALVEA